MEFRQRIAMIGYGVVAQALLPMIVKHLRVPCALRLFRRPDRAQRLRPFPTRSRPRLFPGDKLLLLGRVAEIEKASAFLTDEPHGNGQRPDFERAWLESSPQRA